MAELIFRPSKAAMHTCVCVSLKFIVYSVYVDCRVEMLATCRQNAP